MKSLMRSTLKSVIALVLLLQCASAQIPQLAPFSADVQYSSTGRNGGPARDMDGKLYVSQEAFRTDMQGGPRGESTFIVNIATKTNYVVLPQQHMYIEHKAAELAGRMGRNPMADLKPVDPSNPCSAQEDTACKKVGTEVVNGRSCDHWEMTDNNGTVSNVWIDQKLHFPIKRVSQGSTSELTNVKEGPQDPSLFQVPSGYTKMDINSMMQGMNGSPQQ